MTQHKAAALTSSLFARKGRASPASLLIADLEESGPRQPLAGQAPKVDALSAAINGDFNGGDFNGGDINGSAGGNGGAIPVAALNGALGRRKSRPQVEELPLLAFVAAQEAANSGAAASEISDPDESEPARRGVVVRQDDQPPAASLLDRANQAMRRAKSQAAAPAVEPSAPSAARSDDAERDTGPSAEAVADDEILGVPETVSGDSNIAAIEDAPTDEAGGQAAAEQSSAEQPAVESSAAAAAVEEAEEEAEGEAEIVATAAEVADTAAAGAAAIDAPSAAAPDLAAEEQHHAAGPAKEEAAAVVAAAAVAESSDLAISATVALRQAAALRPGQPPLGSATAAAPPAKSIARPGGQPGVRPAVLPRALPWRSAAVVALGVALGLGAYVAISGKPAPPVTISGGALPQAAPPVEAVPGPAPAVAPVPEAAADPAPLATAVETSQPVAPLPEPSFDVIRIEPNGQSIIAGRALPFSEWILLNNGQPIASIRADANGEWVVLPDAALVPGANAFSLVPKTERGKVAIPAPSQEPAAAPPGPRSEAAPLGGETPAVIALPKPKPAALPQAAPIGVSPGGAYEVQVASVRQSADAERELTRLTTIFSAQLGQLDLRVQKASVEGAGTFYRVRSGAIENLGAAREVCRQLDAVGQGCLVVRRAAQTALGPAQAEGVMQPEPLGAAVRQQAERPQ